ncbi:hypothetical protein GCM10011613_37290 [Cellvibrio zantedeschiae]|uniref:DUF4468 domain-containing protein n=1 Tax=Cellvibrio zantedeschiae TaxID=1237077 RepID=A0ABQ3BAT3_9GAMM|nr:hypothetical protein [Cellvibrio zantedeschiae]GGY88980.1 hypothetical protein GCM10011613_37290 [Cellvibrio zantedeschiae]
MKGFTRALLFLGAIPSMSLATEQLNWSSPEGWKVGSQQGNMIELLKNEESFENWTRLITLQQYQSSEKTVGESFVKLMAKNFEKSCASVEMVPLKSGLQGGYEIFHAFLTCTTNKQNGKGEIYQIKTIKGKEKFFVVQYAYRVEPFQKGGLPLEQSEAANTIGYLTKMLIVER